MSIVHCLSLQGMAMMKEMKRMALQKKELRILLKCAIKKLNQKLLEKSSKEQTKQVEEEKKEKVDEKQGGREQRQGCRSQGLEEVFNSKEMIM